MITSADNLRVKQARSLLTRRGREESGRCLAEGVRLIEDAMGAGIFPALVFSDPRVLTPRSLALLDALANARIAVLEIDSALFQTLSDTVSSQGVIAVIPTANHRWRSSSSLILILDKIRDPGNLGTILRSAEAAGDTAVALAPGCADLWSSKVLRAGMGAHFRLSLMADVAWDEIERVATGRPVWLADASATISHDSVDWTSPSALVIGGETEEFDPHALRIAHASVSIPMPGGAESLNAAMAATVFLFEAARQRRLSTGSFASAV